MFHSENLMNILSEKCIQYAKISVNKLIIFFYFSKNTSADNYLYKEYKNLLSRKKKKDIYNIIKKITLLSFVIKIFKILYRSDY